MTKYSVIRCHDRVRFGRDLKPVDDIHNQLPFVSSFEACSAAAKLSDRDSHSFEVWRHTPEGEAQIAVYASPTMGKPGGAR